MPTFNRERAKNELGWDDARIDAYLASEQALNDSAMSASPRRMAAPADTLEGTGPSVEGTAGGVVGNAVQGVGGLRGLATIGTLGGVAYGAKKLIDRMRGPRPAAPTAPGPMLPQQPMPAPNVSRETLQAPASGWDAIQSMKPLRANASPEAMHNQRVSLERAFAEGKIPARTQKAILEQFGHTEGPEKSRPTKTRPITVTDKGKTKPAKAPAPTPTPTPKSPAGGYVPPRMVPEPARAGDRHPVAFYDEAKKAHVNIEDMTPEGIEAGIAKHTAKPPRHGSNAAAELAALLDEKELRGLKETAGRLGSRYPVPYVSGSKGPMRIEDVNQKHIEHAYRKLTGNQMTASIRAQLKSLMDESLRRLQTTGIEIGHAEPVKAAGRVASKIVRGLGALDKATGVAGFTLPRETWDEMQAEMDRIYGVPPRSRAIY